MKHILVALIKTYKKIISPLLPRACRFYPTCSDYAARAIGKYGAIKGGFMALKRIVKCNPWHPGGIDPVK
jgi:putative membrane protein insertion efficiency factor